MHWCKELLVGSHNALKTMARGLIDVFYRIVVKFQTPKQAMILVITLSMVVCIKDIFL